jgi:hypothetical protein
VAKLVGSINLEGAVDGIAAKEARKRALIKALEHLLGASRQLVPHEEGTLERSGRATVLVPGLLGAVVYDTPYAVRQHEELDYQHDPGRSAKYLETPMTTEHAVMLALMAVEMRKAFGT